MVRLNPERKTTKVPNYFRRSVQYRLLIIVFSLMLVIVLLGEAAKPANWMWLTGSPASSSPLEEDPTIDPRLPAAVPNPAGVVTIERETPVADPVAVAQSPLGIDPARFESIKDDTVFRGSESGLWYDTLRSLRDAANEDWEATEFTPAGFTQLYRQPAQYRGQPVQVHGTIRRAQKVAARRNEQGVEQYWQCWLFPEGTTNPIVVYALEMPAGFPQGMSLTEIATIKGIFFKRWAYVASGGTMSAPLVLAKSAQWTPVVPNVPITMPSSAHVTVLVLGLAALATMTSVLVYRRSQHLGSVANAYRDMQLANSPVERLEAAEIPTPAEVARAAMEQLDLSNPDRGES